jgi:hypothetical protein
MHKKFKNHRCYTESSHLIFETFKKINNVDRNPDRLLRNANDLFVPAHHFATIKRLPLFEFPRSWNEEEENRTQTHSIAVHLQ